MLGVVHDGVADPLIWEMLEKKGNSHSEERMDLLPRFDKIFPDAQIAYICGDREFVGKQWLTYLLIEPQIRFRPSNTPRAIKLAMVNKNSEHQLFLLIFNGCQSQVLSGGPWGKGSFGLCPWVTQ